MKNNVYQTIKIIEKHKEYSLLSSVASARASVEKISSSIASIDNILNGSANKAQQHSIISQNNNDYRILISYVAKDLQKEYTTQHNELSRREFHLHRQSARSKLIEQFVDKKEQQIQRKKAEREQSRLSDLVSITRRKSIFN